MEFSRSPHLPLRSPSPPRPALGSVGWSSVSWEPARSSQSRSVSCLSSLGQMLLLFPSGERPWQDAAWICRSSSRGSAVFSRRVFSSPLPVTTHSVEFHPRKAGECASLPGREDGLGEARLRGPATCRRTLRCSAAPSPGLEIPLGRTDISQSFRISLITPRGLRFRFPSA